VHQRSDDWFWLAFFCPDRRQRFGRGAIPAADRLAGFWIELAAATKNLAAFSPPMAASRCICAKGEIGRSAHGWTANGTLTAGNGNDHHDVSGGEERHVGFRNPPSSASSATNMTLTEGRTGTVDAAIIATPDRCPAWTQW